MVTPVLHVLPLTFRLIFQLLFCCVLSGNFLSATNVPPCPSWTRPFCRAQWQKMSSPVAR